MKLKTSSLPWKLGPTPARKCKFWWDKTPRYADNPERSSRLQNILCFCGNLPSLAPHRFRAVPASWTNKAKLSTWTKSFDTNAETSWNHFYWNCICTIDGLVVECIEFYRYNPSKGRDAKNLSPFHPMFSLQIDVNDKQAKIFFL